MLSDLFRKRFPNARMVLTLGSCGSYYCDCDQVLFQDVFPVTAVDTTAAGDTFTGYFIAETIKGSGPSKALQVAAKAASIAVTRPGAAPSIPTKDEVYKSMTI